MSTNASDILRELYEPAIRQELDNSTALFEKLDPEGAERRRKYNNRPWLWKKARFIKNRIVAAVITLRHGPEHWETW